MQLLQRFIDNWKRKRFAAAGDAVLLAVSGGIDSMVMCRLFLDSGLKFAIAHCNYQLRGEASELDEQHVKEWGSKHNIIVHHTRFNTKEICAEWKKGTQETARILRYEWLDEIRQQYGYKAIATAHHANDNAETILMNLFKGTGISGLHGIKEVNGNIIRPLLFATREEIANYATEQVVTFHEDESNKTDNYLRNAVRHQLIPVADKLFPNAVVQLNESISRFVQAEEIYNRGIDAERKKLIEQRGQDHYISVLKLQKRSPLETICYELFKPFGFSPEQVGQIIGLLSSDSGKYVASSTHRVIRNRNFLVITASKPAEADIVLIEGFPCIVEAGEIHLHFSLVDKGAPISSDNHIAHVDMKNVVLPLTLRKWRTGDYFYPLGMGMKKKKLSKYFKDIKLALHEKERVWVLESNKHIVWVAGMRLDERFKVQANTAKVMRVELRTKN
jgi:tRNA(Ile)-lysidine synthase